MKLVSGLMAMMVMSVFCASAYADPVVTVNVSADKQQAAIKNAEKVRQLLLLLRTSSPTPVPGETIAHYTARLAERSRLVSEYLTAVAAAKAAQ